MWVVCRVARPKNAGTGHARGEGAPTGGGRIAQGGRAWTGDASQPAETPGQRGDRPCDRAENAWTGDAAGGMPLECGSVVAQMGDANVWGVAAATQVGIRRIVVSERAVGRSDAWFRPLAGPLLRRWARRCVVNSPQLREQCLSSGWPAERLCLIPNGVAPNGYDPAAARARLLKELGLPDRVRLIGAVGPLESRKRLKDLIWSADQFNIVRDDGYLLIIGQGPHEWRLRRYSGQVMLRDRVIFLGDRQDVPRLLAGLDCLWTGSQAESVPNGVLEAMAAGIPVVASDIAAHRAMVIPGETGFLVPVGNRPGYARQTLALLADEALRRRCGQQARQLVLQQYRVEEMVNRHVQLYHELIDA